MKAEITSAFYRIAIGGTHVVTHYRGEIVDGRTAETAVRAGCAQWLHDLEKKIVAPAETKRKPGRPRKVEQ